MTIYDINKDTLIDGNLLTESDTLNIVLGSPVPLTLTITGTGPALPGFGIVAAGQPVSIIFNTGGTSLSAVSMSGFGAEATVIVNGSGAGDNLTSRPETGATVGIQFRGMGGNDTMTGRDLGDQLFGGGGDDVMNIEWSSGIRVFGGTGLDVIQGSFAAMALRAITMDLSDGGGGRAILSGVRISDIEAFRGTFSDFGDRFTGGIGRDEAAGARGKDMLDGGDGNDVLRGGDDADVILGGAGRDALFGDGGVDLLTGGLGADRFLFTEWLDMPLSGALRDTITDFEQGKDRIDLSKLAGTPGSPSYDPFTFIGETLFLQGFGTQVGVEVVGANTVVRLYGGDSEAPFGEIVLQGIYDLTARDFIL